MLVIRDKIPKMKYFIVLLSVAVVFAGSRFETSFEDSQSEVDKPFEVNQQEMEDLNIEGDDNHGSQADVKQPTSTHLNGINIPALVTLINAVIDVKLASQPGRSSKTIYTNI